jgi:SAM-dependent methyltransferase
MESKGWAWNDVQDDHWKIPADEVIPIALRWQKLLKKDVLDLGCGIGRHSVLFAEMNYTVSAFDISSEGMAYLKNLKDAKHLAIDIKIGDAKSLPYSNKSFDAVLAFHVIYHADQPGIRLALNEIERVLRQDGEVFLTFISQNSPSYSNPANIIIDDYTRIKTEGIEKGIPHYYVNEKELKELLKSFEIIKLQHIEEITEQDRNSHFFVLAKKK